MAELGLLANLVAVVGVGVQTSLALYSLASTIGSAGRELEDMACDISLFCRVMKQVHKSVHNPTSARLSMTAISDTQDIVARCHAILEDIRRSLDSISGGKQQTFDTLARVKWPFKKPKLLVQRSSLHSCTAFLQLMLSVLDRGSRLSTANQMMTLVDSQDEALDTQMTHSLLFAQQCANVRLQELEEEAAVETVTGDLMRPDPVDDGIESPSRRASQHKPQTFRVKHKSMSGAHVATDKALPSPDINRKRISRLISERAFGAGAHNQTSKSSPATERIGLHQATTHIDDLLRRWTDASSPEMSTYPLRVGQSLDENLQSEPDRASYISWDSQPASLNMARAELRATDQYICVNPEQSLRDVRRELVVSKDEAKRAWEELARREQEERERTICLRSGEPTIIGGIQVVPMHHADETVDEQLDSEIRLISDGDVVRRTDPNHEPVDKSIWVWDNTREEILKVEDQVRGELPSNVHFPPTTRGSGTHQIQASNTIPPSSNFSRLKTPTTDQRAAPMARKQALPGRRSASDDARSAAQHPLLEVPKSSLSHVAKGVRTKTSQNGESAVPHNSFPHAFERWETLSSHWEGLTAYWIHRLEDNSTLFRDTPIQEQMARQITDLSAAGANLFHAVVELQRLRASSERKFQRWFFETREEQERAKETQGELERLIDAGRAEREKITAHLVNVEVKKTIRETRVEALMRNRVSLQTGMPKESSLLWQPKRRLDLVAEPD